MNCRPGDLARVVGLDSRLGLNDRFVKLLNDSPWYLDGIPHWRLEEPIRIVLPGDGVSMTTGRLYSAGERLVAYSLADRYLRPIRDPGDDAVDETLIYAGDPQVRHGEPA